MPMTKKEVAAMNAAIERAELLAALRWTQPIQRDVPPPREGYSSGWDYNSYSIRVFRAWSSSVSHGEGLRGEGESYSSGAQGARHLFSTKKMALIAMRHEIEINAAETLLGVDKNIMADRTGELE